VAVQVVVVQAGQLLVMAVLVIRHLQIHLKVIMVATEKLEQTALVAVAVALEKPEILMVMVLVEMELHPLLQALA
jgi:hypothetical protein